MNTIVEILIDISGSMGPYKKYLLPDGSTRISLAKRILLEEIIRTLDYASNIFVRTFNASQTNNPYITLIYQGSFDESEIRKKIDSIPNETSGNTPITAAILASVENLKNKEYQNHERSIILVTDGEESGEGDYTIAAENAKSIDGIECKIHIVGISLGEKAENKARQLTKTTGGIYLPVKAVNYNPAEMRKVLEPLKASIVQESLKNITSHQVQLNTDSSDKIENLEKKLQTILNGKEYDLLADQIEILKSKIDAVQVHNQKQLSGIKEILEKQQLPTLINGVEKHISQKLNDSFSEIRKTLGEATSKVAFLSESTTSRFKEVDASSINLINRIDDVVNTLSTQTSSLAEINKKLSDFDTLLKRIAKEHNTTKWITWTLIVLGSIASIAFFYFNSTR